MNKKLVMITGLLALPIVYAQRFGYPSDLYGGFGGFGGFGGGYGFFDLTGLYTLYPNWLDFLIFFLIFSGVARLVFTKWFGDQAGAKALYVGVGFALAFGGVYYGYLTLAIFGTFALPFAMLLGGAAIFGLLRMFGMGKFGATLLTLGVMLMGAPLFDAIGGTSYGGFLYSGVNTGILNTVMGGLIVLGIIAGVIHFIRTFGKKRSTLKGPTPETLGVSAPSKPGIWGRLFRKSASGLGKATIYAGKGVGVGAQYAGKGIAAGSVAAAKGAKRLYNKLVEVTDENYTAFTQVQYARLESLVRLIREWILLINDYNQTANPDLINKIQEKKNDALKLLLQIRASARTQNRILKKGRKIAERLMKERMLDHSIAGAYDNLESAEHGFRSFIGEMIEAVRKDDYNKVGKAYGSLRNIFSDMMNNYKLLLTMKKI